MPLHREMAGSVVLDPRGRLLIQQRDDNPALRHPGMLALFGGLREGNETFLECAMREFREELTCSVPAGRFEPLLSYEGPDLDLEGCTSRVEAFVVRDVEPSKLVVTEGCLRIMTRDEVLAVRDRFVPLPWMILETFLQKEANS